MGISWRISVLNYGIFTMPLPQLLPGAFTRIKIIVPYLGFLLQCGSARVLVDTGIDEAHFIGNEGSEVLTRHGGKRYVEAALARQGCTPQDIGVVIFTHLHADHAGNCDLFPNATLVFQQLEWENLLNTLPGQVYRGHYDLSVVEKIRSIKHSVMLAGDSELANGLRVYQTPGHTPGSQSVCLDSDQGPRIIVGDLFHIPPGLSRDNTNAGPTSFQAHPDHLTTDHNAFYRSVQKLKTLTPMFSRQYFLSGHDPLLLETRL